VLAAEGAELAREDSFDATRRRREERQVHAATLPCAGRLAPAGCDLA
jgi:hypothetical protein